MEPTLKEGQVVFVNLWAYVFTGPKVGDIILFDYQDKNLLKRVKKINGASCEVSGDNQTDTLEVGPINLKQIKGKVIL